MTADATFIVSACIKTIFVYFILMHSIYFVLIILGALQQKRFHQEILFGEFKRISESTQTLPISIVICAYNEEKLIVNTVLNMLQLRYPEYEVIVVNDGSKDRTLEELVNTFQMYSAPHVYKKEFETQTPRVTYRSLAHKNLIVIDKENSRRADSNNLGASYARYPIICQIDADCLLEPDSLIYMIRPFLYDPTVIAASGIIRPSNGLLVDRGRIIERGIPKNWLALFQTVEYMRAFQWCRLGLSYLNSLMSISGAYTFVKKDIFIKVGGANTKAVVDDLELTVTLQRFIHEHKELGPMKIAFVPDPGCYTEVPESLRSFASQRNFWERAVLQSMIWNRDMIFNPRYGMAGIFGMPFFLIFEALAPLIELSAYLLAPIAFALGLATFQDIALLFVFGVLLGSLVSVFAVVLQETTRKRQESTSDLCKLLLAAFLDHFGYHQIHLWYRIVGVFDLLIRHKMSHGIPERIGYRTPQ